MIGSPKFVLASGSPRRVQLINQAGIEPDSLRPADIDETPQRGELPRNIGLYLPGSDGAILREASPVTYVKRGQPPMLLIHGTADKGVPWKQSERLCEASRQVGANCELMLIEGAPHGVENWENEERFQVWKPRVIQWLRAVL